MRVLLLGAPHADVAERIAERMRVPHVAAGQSTALAELDLPASGFVLQGFPRSVEDARELDLALSTRAADLDAVVNLDASEELLAHYRGRIVEVDALGSAEDVVDGILGGLREALIAA